MSRYEQGITVEEGPATSVGPAFYYPDLPIAQLRPSPLNPRKHFDAGGIDQLVTSILSVGILEPLVVRPVGDHYEIVAGERRYRAALQAQLPTVPASVRPLSDDQALEIMVIENLQREDVNAVEEGDGFARLLKAGYGVAKLAARIGLSKKYIYDRIKLLQLIPEAAQLLTDGTITAGHAILLARLTYDDQARAIDPEGGGLFVPLMSGDDDDPTESVSVSVREFDAWIERHVRLDLARPVAADEYPEVAAAQETAARVVSITLADYLPPEQASAAAGDRILVAHEWKRADDTMGPDPDTGDRVEYLPCPQSLLGVVVIGRERGTTFPVCVERSCDVHWKKERAEQKKAAAAGSSPDDEKRRREQQDREWKAKQDRAGAERAAYRTGAPKILAAFVARVKALKPSVLVLEVADGAALQPSALKAFPTPKTAEDLLRIMAVSFVAEGLNDEWTAPQQVPLWAKRLGVDLKPLLKPHTAPVQASAHKPATRKIAPQPKPKAATKKARR